MMKWIKSIISWLAKLIKNKKVQKTLFVGAGIGAGIAAGEGAVAYKRNKKAERIKNYAIEKHDKARQAIDDTLEKLGKNKLEVCESFSDLADMIESIQQRPEFVLTVEGVDLPNFKPSEFKRLAAAVEVAVGSAGGVAAGGAVGAAVMGMNIAALGPGALAGSAVLCVMAAKMMGRAAERVEQAKQIEADVEKIIEFYCELEKTVEKYNDVFSDVRKPYEKQNKKENPVAIDITQKRVKTWWGGTKLVPTTKAEQRKMREMIKKIDPSVTVIDSKAKKEQQLEWIDRIEEFDALFNP